MNSQPLIVPDASVLLKWFLDEKDESDAQHALKIRGEFLDNRIRIAIPSLCIYEFGNTISRLIPGQSALMMRYFLDFGFEESTPDQHTLREIIRLVQNYKVTFYDAAYHALAISKQGTFVTADAKYAQRVHREKNITLLNDYGI